MWSLGYSGSFAVSSEGLSGGLALFWSSSISVSLKAYSTQLIDIFVKTEDNAEWRTTLVYGEPRRDLRHVFWDRLRFLKSQWKGPWICVGDFNEALTADEHLGVRERDDNQMAQFRDCLDDCGLTDMGCTGPKYTWSNRQENGRNVRVRLDRAVANGDFLQTFDDCSVENIITTSSDHFAVLVKVAKGRDQWHHNPVQFSFRFEAAWLKAPDYMEMIEENWNLHREITPSLENTWITLNKMSSFCKNGAKSLLGLLKRR
jgi:hypothetical protein